MPRNLSAKTTPIILRCVLKKADVTSREFSEIVLRETGINISRTSMRYLLDNGCLLKRVKDFKTLITQVVLKNFGNILNMMKIEPHEIWEPYQEIDDETDFTEQMNKFMEVTMLSKSTMEHFGLKSSPFTLDIRKESDIYLSASHMYALDVMREVAEYGGFAVITGQVGSGKSTIFSKFLEETRVNNKYQIIFPEAIDKTRLNAKQILQACIYDLSESNPKGSMEALSRQVKELLIKRNDNSDRTVLVIEEAHDLPTNTLKYLKRLWELKSGLQRLMGIILIGQNELESRLYGKANTEIREVTARTTHVRVEPIKDEIGDYLTHRVKTVKGDINKIITPDAIAELSKRMTLEDRHGKKQSVAYPLMINNIMNRLMNYCADSGEDVITAEIIISVGV